MSTIVTRAGKGSPLTNNEVDSNFTNLNTDKVESITSADGSVVVSSSGTTRDLSVGIAGSTATLISQVRNETGTTLTKGTVVYITGASGNKAVVSRALATGDSTSAQTYGMVQADIPTNHNGYVVIIGAVSGLNTSAFTDGTQLYLSSVSAGGYTNTKPYAPSHLVYVGIVTYSHNTQGTIQVKIQNGYEMDELHDVSARSPVNGQTLVWNSTTSLWEKSNAPILSGATIDASPIGASTASTGAFTTLNTSGIVTMTGRNEVYGVPTNAGTIAGFIGGTSGGTTAARTQTLSGQTTLNIAALGYTGTGWVGGAGLSFVATENQAAATRGTKAVLSAIAAGDSTATTMEWNGSTLTLNGSTALTSSNYNNYAPTKTGTGASGTWAINITGNAATATSATDSTKLPLAGGTLTGSLIINTGTSAADYNDVWIGGATGWATNESHGINTYYSATPATTAIFTRIDSLYNGTVAVMRWKNFYYGAAQTSTVMTLTATSATTAALNVTGAITQASNQVLHAGNYTSYSPTLTGGSASGTWGISITGNAATATSLATARTISLTSDVTGSVSFNGSADVSITATVADDSHNHTNFTVFGGVSNLNSISGVGETKFRPFTSDFQATNRSGSNYNAGFDIGAAATGFRSQFVFEANTAATGPKFRNLVDGSWGSWYELLHSANYNSYSPTLTGGNASGTWGISITGNAATATYATTAGSTTLLAGLGSYGWSASTNGRSFNNGIQAMFVQSSNGYQSYGSVVRVNTYSNDGGSAELYFPYSSTYGGSAMQYRLGQYDNAGWTGWKTVLDNSNYSAYALPLGGGTVSGQLYLSANGQGVNNATLKVNGDITAARGNGATGVIYLGNSGGTYVYYDGANYAMPNGQLDVNGSRVLTAGNYTNYTLPLGGSWYGTGLPGTRWNGLAVSGGEIVFGNGLPNANQMGILVDGCYVAGENNGFWSMGSDNTWGSRRGMFWDGTYLNFTQADPVGLFRNFQVGTATAYDNPGGWSATSIVTGTYHARVRVRGTSYNSSGDNEVYLWVDNTVTPRSGIYSSTAFNIAPAGGLYESGNRVLNASNYSSYAQPLIGYTPAYGNAAYQVLNLDTIKTPGLYHYDGGVGGTTPNGSPNYRTIEIGTNDRYSQIAMPWDSANMFFRRNQGGWQAWRTVIHDGNYSSYALPLNGGTLSGNVTLNTAEGEILVTPTGWRSSDRAAIKIRSKANTPAEIDLRHTVGGVESGWHISARDTSASSELHLYRYNMNSSGAADSSSFLQMFTFHPSGAFNASGSITQNGNQVLHAGNYTSYSPSLTGGGASGTWGISISGSASSASNASNAWQVGTDTGSKGNALQYWQQSGNTTLNPNGNWHYAIRMSHGDADTYYSATLALDFHEDTFQFRRKVNGANQSWRTLLHSGNYSSYALPLSGGTVTGATNFNSNVLVGNNGSSFAYDAASLGKLYFGSSSSDASSYYHIGTEMENVGGNYSKLDIKWYTGIRLYAHNAYGGFRFKEITTGATLFSVGESDLNTRVANTLFIGGNTALHAGNYNSYSPTLTGGNASGTWGISISGNAATATKTTANSGYARVGYGMAPFYNWGGSNAGAGAPSDSTYTTGIDVGSNPGDQAYGFQIASNMWNVGLWTRTYNSGFSGWVRILDSSNYSSYALPLSGGTLTGSLALSDNRLYLRTNGDTNHYLWNADDDWEEMVAYAGTGFRVKASTGPTLATFTTSAVNAGVALQQGGNQVLHAGNFGSYAVNRGGDQLTGQHQYIANRNTSSDSAPLQAFSNNGGGATMAFHRGGYYAVNFGLDSDNVMRIGGWSASTNRLQMDMSGNLTMAGNVTAYSDERLKKDWAVLPSDFVERLAKIKSGTYTRIDSDERQVGVSAQGLQEFLAEAVQTDNDGMLSVNYGGAALASAVELAKRVVDQEKRIAHLESLINKLIGD
jgi:hypothetical protein